MQAILTQDLLSVSSLAVAEAITSSHFA